MSESVRRTGGSKVPMRFIALLLCYSLVLSAQQPAAPPPAPEPPPPAPQAQPDAPKVQPGTPASTAQPPVGAGAVANMDSMFNDPSAPWFGTKNYWKKNFGHQDLRVTVGAPVRLQEYVVEGKLTLSMRNFIDLVVANNTDIASQKLTVEIPKNAIQRAFGVFDPTVASNFSATRQETPATNTLQGANILSQLDQPFSVTYNQMLAPGTTAFSTLSTDRLSTNSQYNVFNPAFTTTWAMGFSQPLLRNRGVYVNKLPILIARANKRVADFNLNSNVQQSIVNAVNAYWDLVSARERLVVQQQALGLADQALKRARREVELGATSPLEIFQPEQNYATAEIGLTQVQYQLQIAEDALRRQIGADLDPSVRNLPIVLTEQVAPTGPDEALQKEPLIAVAMSKRPDLQANLESLTVNDYQLQSALNALKPLLNFTGRYITTGRGGTAYIQPETPPGEIIPPPQIVIPGGIGNAFGQMFDFTYGTWAMAITLSLPLRDRAGSANLSDAVVNKKLNALQLRSVQQQIRQDVLTAINLVENSKANVRLAKIALDYAQKRADADQKRYDLGVINIFFLLDAQNALTQAQSNVVNQTVQYRRNLLNLQQRLGTVLEDNGIVID